MEKAYIKEVAETIKKQLYANISEVWAWGSCDFYFLERKHDEETSPALMFSIRTPKIPKGGKVIISLDWCDEYIVEAVRIINGKEFLIGKEKGVYAFQLHDIINSLIEDEESYKTIVF